MEPALNQIGNDVGAVTIEMHRVGLRQKANACRDVIPPAITDVVFPGDLHDHSDEPHRH